MTKLLILSSSTGEGHNSAATAIAYTARGSGLQVTIRRPVEESTGVNRSLANFYNTLLIHRPEWMGSYFRLINSARPNEREFLYLKVRRYIARFIESAGADIVLSVHPMLNHFIQRFIKEERLGIACYTFLTDPFPPFWHGWISPYIDRYFVPTDEAFQALVGGGIPPSRSERVPMPVRPQFVPAALKDIHELRQALQLDGPSTILINGGARGGGPVFDVYQTIRNSAGASNILVVCGRNGRLRRRIERLQDRRTRAFGFLEDIHRYVGASDLVVTKPGALSGYEALACGVPVLFTGMRGLMPQESGLFEASSRYDFGFAARTFEELKAIIQMGPAEWNRKRPAVSKFYQSSSGEELIERIQPEHVRA